ncbi:MAG: hypothetical protein KAX80_09180 [Planctomycetes bacterium]|nr:hypothetical protein [Planctomycetota bacterium]
MSEGVTVREQDLLQVLKWFRDLRIRALKKRIDPWAFRQGILLILQLDTQAALERGVTLEALQKFDRLTRTDAENIQPNKGRVPH